MFGSQFLVAVKRFGAGSHLAGPSPFTQSLRFFANKVFSKARTKRAPLTSKKAGKGYYKGKGVRTIGRHTSLGLYIVDPKKVTRLVVPDLEGFGLKAYVARAVGKTEPQLLTKKALALLPEIVEYVEHRKAHLASALTKPSAKPAPAADKDETNRDAIETP
ncbi:mitochondrial ribosomal protein L27-domain-containing protein [Pelagophyceae sp. CCMP2097]|nr:mitochondrial ribosomal protein L27-domain-containing protein [Pelagophyceae sp. CCMP2097]|mmetsp:Transcript_26333/g.88513  ORF Transcript_26333/g.88513 Transcript_26333/m.88513 type:complete len:161 (-) Transcript_26333:12-494(-)